MIVNHNNNSYYTPKDSQDEDYTKCLECKELYKVSEVEKDFDDKEHYCSYECEQKGLD